MSGSAHRLKEIFGAALELPAGVDRAAWLDRECGSDLALRSQVEALFRSHDQAGHFLAADEPGASRATIASPIPGDDTLGTINHASDPGPFGATPAAEAPTVEAIGTVIGVYRLIRQLGVGGMGVVFLAEQDRPIRRKVALKVIKPGMDSRQVIARFEAERQALALMEHPNIARVLDGGATPTGLPYFVMELVHGVPITEYCDQHHLTPRERLELFLPVCQAIQHAHQKGIIHRDIKPSNILVSDSEIHPEVKVIDFGVAKATEQRLTERTVFTEFGALIGTLEYMSPEQAGMGAIDIDTRSDIYALGVLLYELLTGSTPLEKIKLRQVAYGEILRRIREEEPSRPSTRLSESGVALASISAQRQTEPARLSRLIRGDLDWIIMKALDKDRMRRYETASGFARDIQRHLDGHPVEAGPPSASYRVGKFARRHRVALATASTFGVGLILATTLSLTLAYWANRERVRADSERRRALAAESVARQQRDLALDRQQVAQRERARAETAEAQTRREKARAEQGEQDALRAIEKFNEVVEESPQLKNDPALAPLRRQLLKQPQAFYQKLRNRLSDDRVDSPHLLNNLAAANYNLALLTDEIGDKADALAAYEAARAIWEPLAQQDPSNDQIQEDLADTCLEIGSLRQQTNQVQRSLECFQAALVIYQRRFEQNPADQERINDLIRCYGQLSMMQQKQGLLTEASHSLEQVIALARRLERDDAEEQEIGPTVIWSEIQLERLRSGSKQTDPLLLGQVLQLQEKIAQADPNDEAKQTNLAQAYLAVSRFESAAGHGRLALDMVARASKIMRALRDQHPSVTGIRAALVEILLDEGWLQRSLQRHEEASATLEEARSLSDQLVQDNQAVPRFLNNQARGYREIGLLRWSMHLYEDALQAWSKAKLCLERLIERKANSPLHRAHLASLLNQMGLAYGQLGRVSEALGAYDTSRQQVESLIREQPANPHHPLELASLEHNAGNLLNRTNQAAEALVKYKKARDIRQNLTLGEPRATSNLVQLGYLDQNISDLERRQGLRNEALASADRATATRTRLVDKYPKNSRYRQSLAASLSQIGLLRLEGQELAPALMAYEKARDLHRQLVAESRGNREDQKALAETEKAIDRLVGRMTDRDQILLVRDRSLASFATLAQANPLDSAARQTWLKAAGTLVELNRQAGRMGGALAVKARVRLVQNELDAADPELVDRDARLTAALRGPLPTDPADLMTLARRAAEKGQFADAVRLYAAGLDQDPALSDDRSAQYRSEAAVAAIQASWTMATDPQAGSQESRVRFRQQALDWLRAELKVWSQIQESGSPEARQRLIAALRRWRNHVDLAPIRNKKELAQFPPAERAAFERFWSEVARLFQRARSAPTDPSTSDPE